MIREQKARMTLTQMKAHKAFCLLSFDDMMKTLMGQQIAPSATQQKKKRNQKTRQQYKRRILQQTNVENIVKKIQHVIDNKANNTVTPTTLHQTGKQNESTTRHADNSTVNNISLLSTIPHYAFRFSNAPLIASFASLRHHVGVPPYIRQEEDMKAIGQG